MKGVFIGSSAEAIAETDQLAGILRRATSGVRVETWKEVFPPGLVPLQVLQDVSKRVSGAILLATPDDEATIRGERLRVPRANVMLEFGFFMGMLSPRNVAVCKYDGVALPSDLNGVTHIAMGERPSLHPGRHIEGEALDRILSWVHTLPHVAEGSPATTLYHGYIGRWKISTETNEWVGTPVRAPDYVHCQAYWDLIIPAGGQPGYGACLGDVYASIGSCHAHFQVAEEISDVRVNAADGSVSLLLTFHSRKRVQIEGDPGDVLGFRENLHGPGTQRWLVHPSADQRDTLIGKSVEMDGTRSSRNQIVTARRLYPF